MTASPAALVIDETPYMNSLKLALGRFSYIRLWRQNCGKIPIYDSTGTLARYFHAGPPNGAADLSGVVYPNGWRLEIETKSSLGKQRKEQKTFERMIVSMGGIYVLCTPGKDVDMQTAVRAAVVQVHQAIIEKRNLTCKAISTPSGS